MRCAGCEVRCSWLVLGETYPCLSTNETSKGVPKNGDSGLDCARPFLHAQARKKMGSKQPRLVDLLLDDWTGFLDPRSFLKLQRVDAGSFLDAASIHLYWSNLFKTQLQHLAPLNAPPAEICLHTSSFLKFSIKRAGSCQKLEEVTGLACQKLWWEAHQELFEDFSHPDHPADQPDSDTKDKSSTTADEHHYGSLQMTAGNELRNLPEDFSYPALVNFQPGEDAATLLQEVEISRGPGNLWIAFCQGMFGLPLLANGFSIKPLKVIHLAGEQISQLRKRFTSCRLRAPLGGDRCVMARGPLPRLGTATALPDRAGAWQIAWRPCSYYEVRAGLFFFFFGGGTPLGVYWGHYFDGLWGASKSKLGLFPFNPRKPKGRLPLRVSGGAGPRGQGLRARAARGVRVGGLGHRHHPGAGPKPAAGGVEPQQLGVARR